MRCEIINGGDEVLCGKVVNTNASFLAIELEKIGIEVVKVITIGDDRNDLNTEIDNFKKSNIDYLITTGGLGPTHDDFTKEVLYENLGLQVVQRKEPLELLNKYFRGKFTDCNLKQTYYPQDAHLLPNDKGTAMGAYNEYNHKAYTVLVGPPSELKPMVNDYLIPFLKTKVKNEKIIKEYIVMGIGEAQVEDILKDYYEKYPNVEINPYFTTGKVRYQVTSYKQFEKEFKCACDEFVSILGKYIISDKNENIEDKVFQELKRLNYHISFSESCTGGLLAGKLINTSGASSVIDESLVTYSNESKIKYLHVSKETIDKYDVVSEEVAIEMAKGIQNFANTEVGVSVTGYAGPTGGTEKIPVGTVCFAICVKDKVFSKTLYYRTERNILRERSVMTILYYLFDILRNIN